MAIAGSFVVGAWIVCTPLCFFFAFHYKPTEGLFGLWLALAIGYAVTTLLSFISVCRSDWDEIVRNVKKGAEAPVEDG